MPASWSPSRPRAPALGLILPLALAPFALAPLALAGAAQAQQAAPPAGWVDPPSRPTAAGTAAEGMKGGSGMKGEARAGAARGGASDEARKAAPADDALPKAAATRSADPAPAAVPTLARSRPEPGRAVARAPRVRTPDTPAAIAAAPDASGRAAAARALAARYLATVSAPGAAMVGATPRFYASRVRFYGRPTTLAGLIAEKRSFVRRWPERRYEPRTIRAECDGRTCTVRAVVDFRAESPDRGAVSRGAAELTLEIGFSGAHPAIVAEGGRVLRRGARSAALAPSPGKA